MFTDFSLPFSYNRYKDLSTIKDADAISQSVKNILLTQKGEYPGDVDFGSRLSSLIFVTSNDFHLSSIIAEEIRTTLHVYEPRIYDVSPEILIELDKIDISVHYKIKNSKEVMSTKLFFRRLR